VSNHILLSKASRKNYTDTPDMPAGSYFNNSRGVWMKDNQELITHDSETGIEATKKCDVETGEDQKGE